MARADPAPASDPEPTGRTLWVFTPIVLPFARTEPTHSEQGGSDRFRRLLLLSKLSREAQEWGMYD